MVCVIANTNKSSHTVGAGGAVNNFVSRNYSGFAIKTHDNKRFPQDRNSRLVGKE